MEFSDMMKRNEGLASEPVKCGKDALLIHYFLLHTAIQNCHTFKRWRIIHNLLLEKLPGNPLIDKLRTIHLMEVDYNGLLKLFMAKRLCHLAEKHGTIADEQGGGRASQAAIDGAALKVFPYELIQMTQTNATNVNDDATACFDRIIENQANMSCRRHGANRKFLKLHSQPSTKFVITQNTSMVSLTATTPTPKQTHFMDPVRAPVTLPPDGSSSATQQSKPTIQRLTSGK